MHATSVEGVDDMIQLGDLSEAGLLRNLLVRHRKGLIYTYTGSVLVAVNPYKDLPLYTQEQVKLYHGQKLGELPPHVFAIADTCYYNLKRYDTDQCCIISGESGAGKTESSKLILQYLAAISGRRSNLEQQILESNPILEAFGNAKTIRNDNSSRFGKYLEISFNQDGAIEGARVEQYLLEKCRVCHQAEAERNFHIFYCMLAGLTAEQKKKLSLKDAKAYKFLTRGGSIVCNGRDDAKDFGRIGSALKVLTFRESQSWEIYKLLAAILHLGNISFEGKAFLLEGLLERLSSGSESRPLMTQRSFLTNRETVTKPLNKEQAADCRDALVKAVYNKMFLWIVGKINGIIGKAVKEDSGSSHRSIGLLDIFGFENFLINSFEQLCINLANEKLQQFFVVNIFELEQKEYLRQGVVWDNITFSDNKPTLELLVSKPCNLLAMIDEESQFPKGTDSTMLYKMNQQHKENKGYVSSKNEHDSQFGIKHFAGQVFYDSNGFLEKNRDAISSNIIMMISISKNKLLHDIFKSELSNKGVKKSANNKAMGDKKQMPTLSGQFRRSLESLMKALDACQPFFIRCFKPNKDKNSEGFDRELCMVQLRYSGMMDTVRIRKLGFPIRHTFKDFMFRYRVLLNTSDGACCQAICTALIRGKDQWKVGKSKLFLKVRQRHTTEEVEEKEKKKKKKEEEEEEEPFKEDKEFSFQKFCSLHFQGDASHTHISQRLREPLLAHQDERDSLACLTVWWIILRFMGDMVEPRAPDPSNPQARRTSSAYHPSMVQRQGRRLSSMVEDVLIGEGPTLDRPLTPLEKLHIIVGYGLSRPGIRDEIFCQILKQLMGNGDKEVCLRGWTLLSMCLSSFPPSQILIKYLENFLRRGPKGYAAYCADRLRRTVANGEREEVPCEMELQATESKKPMDVTVSLMDGRKFTLQVDAACTSGEVLREVAQKINLTDTYGFSLYISIMEKRWSLGSSGKHVMDSVSQCEHAVRQQGSEESRAPWQLWVRKEMFTPWHDCAVDPVSTELIYRQVLLGLKAEEYVCDKEDEYAQLAAKHYFVQFGAENTPQNTRRAVEDCITSSLIDAKSRAKWNQLVGSIHAQVNSPRRHDDPQRSASLETKSAIDRCQKSLFDWTHLLPGPPLPLSRFALAINSTGVSFMDGKDTKLLEIPNVELTGATVTSTRTAGKDLNRVGATQLAFRERLWVTSKEPLKQPLLRTLTNNSELSTIACNAFVDILSITPYMGDYPIKHARSPMELTDQIFGPATQHPALQDEIYCQIMKQMTNNRNRVSMELGWQLLWLCTGLFPPSNSLAKHAHRFLKSRPRDPLASDCLKRLQNILRSVIRLRCVIQNIISMILDLCSTIATQLNLSSPDGYGLFMKTAVKVRPAKGSNPDMYFFDSLRQNAEPPKKIKKAKEATPSAFLVFFMRKLWFNVIPGRDLTADLTFHYPQEMPRYLRGYHNCSREDMIELAALLFRIQTDSDRSQFVMIPRMLKELVPDDQIDLMSSDEWKKVGSESGTEQLERMGITADEARVNFLKVISSWPTFGCTFFEVKVSHRSNAFSIMSTFQELLVMHPFGKITDWQTDNHHFHMSIGGLVQGTFSCETPLVNTGGDTLISY
uniref:Myosin VIIBb n=1 Tax=Gadus morhua TaxID=8049 RepID=A0A8C5AQ86_GADMO